MYCGSRNHRSEQRHDDKGHKQRLPNQRVLERQQPENYLHRAARVHGQADSPRGAPVDPAQARASARAEKLSGASDHDHANVMPRLKFVTKFVRNPMLAKKNGANTFVTIS